MANAVDGTLWHAVDQNALLKIINFAAISGSPPAITTAAGFKIQVGTAVTTSNSSGGWSITYPVAFSGVPIVVPVVGDNAPSSALSLSLIHSLCSATSFSGTLFSGTSGVATATFRLSYIAFGY